MSVDYSALTEAISKLEELATEAESIANTLTTEVLEVSGADLSNVKQKFTKAATQLRAAKSELSSKKAELQNQEKLILG